MKKVFILLFIVLALNTLLSAQEKRTWDYVGTFYYDGTKSVAKAGVGAAGNRLYGVVQYDGTTMLSPRYDGMLNFSAPFTEVELDGKIGFINTAGQLITELIYDKHNFRYPVNSNIALVRKGAKWGYINQSGEEFIPLEYDYAYPFNNAGYAVVMKGEIILNEWGGLENWKNRTMGLIDSKGGIVFPLGEYDWIGEGAYTNHFIVQKNGKFGAISASSRKIMIPAKYDDIEPLDGESSGDTKHYVVTSENKKGLVTYDGELVIRPNYSTITYSEVPGRGALFVKDSYGQIAVFSMDGSVVLDFGRYTQKNEYGWSQDFNYFLCNRLIALQGKKFGFLDSDGKEAVPFIYDYASPFSEDWEIACVMMRTPGDGHIRTGKYGAVDVDGNIVIPLIYDREITYDRNGIYAEKEGKGYVLDKNGNVVRTYQATD